MQRDSPDSGYRRIWRRTTRPWAAASADCLLSLMHRICKQNNDEDTWTTWRYLEVCSSSIFASENLLRPLYTGIRMPCQCRDRRIPMHENFEIINRQIDRAIDRANRRPGPMSLKQLEEMEDKCEQGLPLSMLYFTGSR